MTTEEKLAKIAKKLAAKKAAQAKDKNDLTERLKGPKSTTVKDLADRVAQLEEAVSRLM